MSPSEFLQYLSVAPIGYTQGYSRISGWEFSKVRDEKNKVILKGNFSNSVIYFKINQSDLKFKFDVNSFDELSISVKGLALSRQLREETWLKRLMKIVKVTKTDLTDVMTEIRDALKQSDRFSKTSGRDVSIDGNTLVIKYAGTDKDVSQVDVTMSAALDTTLNTSVQTQTESDKAVVSASQEFADGTGEFLRSGALTLDWTPNLDDPTQNYIVMNQPAMSKLFF